METARENENIYSRLLHHNMAVVGGIFGIYTILIRGSILGNAQTMNLIQIVVSVFGNNWIDAALRMFGVLLFVATCIGYVILKNNTNLNLKKMSLFLDIVAIIISAILPQNFNNIIALYPVFIATAFQWNVFYGCFGYVSATIFSTNNMKQFSLAIGEYICSKDRKHLKKAVFFAGSLAGFYIGVAIGVVTAAHFRVHSIAVAGIFIISGWVLLKLEERTK